MPDPSTLRRVAILGATSAMAEATARRLAERGDSLALVARRADRLDAIAADLRSRGAEAVAVPVADLSGMDQPDALFGQVGAALGGLDAVLIFHGVLDDVAVSEADAQAAARALAINFNSPIELALAAVRRLETSDHPRPVVLAVGSVAGDRGRGSNYVYGAAKAGLGVFMQGLHHRLAQKGSRIRAVVVKPGFVDTPMTDGLHKGGPLWASPAQVASVIARAMEGGGAIVYAPWFWRWILLVIRLLPQPIINRTKL